MNYMDMLQGSTRTHTPVVRHATIDNTRRAIEVATIVEARDYVPSREIMDCFRQDRYGK